MISGRDNFRRSIEFEDPRYLPSYFDCDLDWLRDKDARKRRTVEELKSRIPDDILGFLWCWKNEAPPEKHGGQTSWTDEWKVGWIDSGFGARVASHPLQGGYHLLEGFRFPDPHSEDRFEDADAQLAARAERYVLATVWFTLFERMWMLRGFDNILTDPYTDMKGFCYLRDRIVETNLAMIDRWLERDVDGIFFSDDWGSQRALLISPEDWRRLYRPSYERMFARVRDGGAHVWMHLCGNIQSILPDLVEIGLDVLNPVQPQAMDVRELARDFGGELCFFGGVDVQQTLTIGTPEDVKEEFRDLVELFGTYDGGYIAGTSHSIMPETPLDNVIALYEAVLEYAEPS